MLVMSSNGLSSRKLHDEIKKYINKEHKRAVIITTASVGYKENDWHIPQLVAQLQVLGLEVCCFDIEFEPVEQLLQYDVIAINGGNPFYLLKEIRKTGCTEIFRSLIEAKVVIGISAGSIVFQESIDLVAQYSAEMNEGVGLSDFKGMYLTAEEILPHYHRFINKYDRFEERAIEYEIVKNKKITRIDDGEALIIVNSGSYVV